MFIANVVGSLAPAKPSLALSDRLNLKKHALLTDNFAPVDYMAAQLTRQLTSAK